MVESEVAPLVDVETKGEVAESKDPVVMFCGDVSDQRQPHQQQQHHNQNQHHNRRGGGGDGGGKVPNCSSRSRLFIGNIPGDFTVDDVRSLFGAYGLLLEPFVNTRKSFAIVRLASHESAERACSEVDGRFFKGKSLRVRFASHYGRVRVKHLPAHVTNELLAEAFSMFGRVERAVVVADDRGKSTGEGIVDFERKGSAARCQAKCREGCFVLTADPRPVSVELVTPFDDETGVRERNVMRSKAFFRDRANGPRFIRSNNSLYPTCLKWKQLGERKTSNEEQTANILAEAKCRIYALEEQLRLETDHMMIESETRRLQNELDRRHRDLSAMERRRTHESLLTNPPPNMTPAITQNRSISFNQLMNTTIASPPTSNCFTLPTFAATTTSLMPPSSTIEGFPPYPSIPTRSIGQYRFPAVPQTIPPGYPLFNHNNNNANTSLNSWTHRRKRSHNDREMGFSQMSKSNERR